MDEVVVFWNGFRVGLEVFYYLYSFKFYLGIVLIKLYIRIGYKSKFWMCFLDTVSVRIV